MSAVEETIVQVKRSHVTGLPDGVGRPTPIEDPIGPDQIASYINRTKQLTDEAYEELVHDIGWRVALLVLRSKAWSGDVRALDLYNRIVTESKSRRAKPKREPSKDVTPPVFKPKDRPPSEQE